LGVFSKESAVALLGIVVLYDVMKRTPLRRAATGWLSVAIPIVLLLFARAIVLTAPRPDFPIVDNPIVGAGFVTGRLTALTVMARYLLLIVWPLKLSAD